MTTAEIAATPIAAFDIDRHRAAIHRELAKRSFLTLATVSAAQRPHVAGVLYVEVDGALYLNVHDTSIKARNIRENPRVALCIPVRKVPVGPPYVIHFQGTAELLPADDPGIAALIDAGRLKPILTKGVLDDPHSCFVRISPGRTVTTFGIGVSLLKVIREPLQAMRTVDW